MVFYSKGVVIMRKLLDWLKKVFASKDESEMTDEEYDARQW